MDSNGLISTIQVQGGLDVTAAQALELGNAAYQSAVAAARYLQAEKSFGSTVAGQEAYTLDDQAVVGVEVLFVGAGTDGYRAVGIRQRFDLKSGALQLPADWDGAFSQEFNGDGTVKQFALYPVPTSGGDAITGLAALEAVALDTGVNTAIRIPVDLHEQLADCAILLGKSRFNGDGSAAQAYVALRDDLVAKLERRKNARVGSATVEVPVVGYHF